MHRVGNVGSVNLQDYYDDQRSTSRNDFGRLQKRSDMKFDNMTNVSKRGKESNRKPEIRPLALGHFPQPGGGGD
jgi:hypothetical protein